MGIQQLVRLEREPNLRVVWTKEDEDFTPWLFDNIEELGDAIGLRLASQEREAAIGKYSLDILATDIDYDQRVVIENQLETSDHDHLGKLLTYAADSDRNVRVIWVARKFEVEHKKALRWLNDRTDKNTLFFGVTVELWRIDESRLAPHFALAVAPDNWPSGWLSPLSSIPSERMERYRSFFQDLIDVLREKHNFTRARKAQPQPLYLFATGSREFKYWASFIEGQQARIDLRIETGERERNLAIFEALKQARSEIEEKYDHPLFWDPMEGNRACRIAIHTQGSIDDDADSLTEILNWMVENLQKFKAVIGHRLPSLARQGLFTQEQLTIE